MHAHPADDGGPGSMRQAKNGKGLNPDAPQGKDVVIHGVGMQGPETGPHHRMHVVGGRCGGTGAGQLPHDGFMIRRGYGCFDGSCTGADRYGKVIVDRGLRIGEHRHLQGRVYFSRIAAERRTLQTPRECEERQDQNKLNSPLHLVRMKFSALRRYIFIMEKRVGEPKR